MDSLSWYKLLVGIFFVITICLIGGWIIYQIFFADNGQKNRNDYILKNDDYCKETDHKELCKIPLNEQLKTPVFTNEYNVDNAEMALVNINKIRTGNGIESPTTQNMWYTFESNYNDIPYGVGRVTDEYIIILFRGADGKNSSERGISKIVNQIPFSDEKSSEDLLCHEGWLGEFNKFKSDIELLLSPSNTLPVFISGYDMGSAFATYTTKLALSMSGDRNVMTYIFGGLRSTNKDFIDDINSHPKLLSFYSIENSSDEITSFPGPVIINDDEVLQGYYFAGSPVIFDDNRESLNLNHSLPCFYHNLNNTLID